MITSYLYRKGKACENNIPRAQMLAALNEKDTLLWVDLEEPNDFESETLVEIFNFHPLAVEDCITDISQPKVDDYEEYLFLVMHAVKLKDDSLSTTELDIFLGKNYVVTFHTEPLKSVDQVKESIRKKPDFCLGHGPDLLVHALLDHLVDNYQPVLDQYEEKIDKLEDEIFNHPAQDYLETIMRAKRDVFHFRRTIAPQRDTLNYLTRNPTVFIKAKNLIYFRDVYDHLFRIYGTVEGFHEAISGILQAYFSYSSNKLNEVMKRMTVMATLTMPSIIIASIYGMNFKNMPELDHPYGYLFSFVLMGVTSIGMLLWMKWKKWI